MERQLINFVDKGYASKERLTRIWEVRSKVNDVWLGHVKWFGQWRRYCFFPASTSVFDPYCLSEIAGFVITQTEERKASWASKTKRARGE